MNYQICLVFENNCPWIILVVIFYLKYFLSYCTKNAHPTTVKILSYVLMIPPIQTLTHPALHIHTDMFMKKHRLLKLTVTLSLRFTHQSSSFSSNTLFSCLPGHYTLWFSFGFPYCSCLFTSSSPTWPRNIKTVQRLSVGAPSFPLILQWIHPG